MSAIDYRARDREEIEALLDGYAPSTSPSSNWRGVAPPNRFLDPEPETSKDQANPTMFVIPVVSYDEESIESGFDQDDPFRRGWVEFSGHIDVGAGTGLFAQHVWPSVLERFQASTSDRLIFVIEQAVPVPASKRGDWYLDGFRVPFIGR